MTYDIVIKGNEFVRQQWETLSEDLRHSFEYAVFNFDYSTDGLIREIQDDIYSNRNIAHVLAVTPTNLIVGGLFGIQLDSTKCCEVGWFFTSSSLPTKVRVILSDAIINKLHDYLKGLGYTCIETDMGTAAGEKYLTKKFNYEHHSEREKNRWIKVL